MLLLSLANDEDTEEGEDDLAHRHEEQTVIRRGDSPHAIITAATAGARTPAKATRHRSTPLPHHHDHRQHHLAVVTATAGAQGVENTVKVSAPARECANTRRRTTTGATSLAQKKPSPSRGALCLASPRLSLFPIQPDRRAQWRHGSRRSKGSWSCCNSAVSRRAPSKRYSSGSPT